MRKIFPETSPGKVLSSGIRRSCFLSGQFPVPTGERWRRPESALRIMPLSLACLSSSERHDSRGGLCLTAAALSEER